MQARHEDFRAASVEIVAISTSGVEDHRRLADRIGARFPILADTDGVAISAYGLLHPGGNPLSDRPIARPAVFLIDGGGVVRKRFFTENWRVRMRAERLLDELRDL